MEAFYSSSEIFILIFSKRVKTSLNSELREAIYYLHSWPNFESRILGLHERGVLGES